MPFFSFSPFLFWALLHGTAFGVGRFMVGALVLEMVVLYRMLSLNRSQLQ